MRIGYPFARAHHRLHEELIRSLNETAGHFVATRRPSRSSSTLGLSITSFRTTCECAPHAEDARRLRKSYPA